MGQEKWDEARDLLLCPAGANGCFAKCPMLAWLILLAFCHIYLPETIGRVWGYE